MELNKSHLHPFNMEKPQHPYLRRLQDAQDRRSRSTIFKKESVAVVAGHKPLILRDILDRVREEHAGDDRISDFELHELYVNFLENLHNLKTGIKDPNKNFNLLMKNIFFIDEERRVGEFDPEIAQVFLDTVHEKGKTEVIQEMHDSAMISRDFQNHMTQKYDAHAPQSREYIKAMVWLGERIKET